MGHSEARWAPDQELMGLLLAGGCPSIKSQQGPFGDHGAHGDRWGPRSSIEQVGVLYKEQTGTFECHGPLELDGAPDQEQIGH